MSITNTSELNEAIALLQTKAALEKAAIKEQVHEMYENLKPANMIKNWFGKMIDPSGIANDLVDTSLGLGAGALTKKIFVGASGGFLKNIIGNFIELSVTNFVAKNADGIKEKGIGVLDWLIKSIKKKKRSSRIKKDPAL